MRDIDVVVVGELNVDLILQGDVTPAFGQAEKLIADATLTLGSSSAIFACGAAQLGLRVAFVGKVGDDEFGGFVLRALAERNVDTGNVVIDPAIKTGLSVILSRDDDRAILTHLGSIAALRLEEINQSIFREARHLHLGSYFLLDALRPDIPALFRQARASGLSTSLDTNYDPAEDWDGGLVEALSQVDIFLPNETELCAITGQNDLKMALNALAGQVSIVAAKLGSHGAIIRQGDRLFEAEALPIPVVDTTGAGDTFDAGFIYGYLANWDISRALRFACICGSLSTRAAGGTTAQPTLSEALEVM